MRGQWSELQIIWPWFKNFSLGKPSFSFVVPHLQTGTVRDVCQACMAEHFSITPNSWCTFRLSMPSLSWADLFRLFDQAVSKRTGTGEAGVPGIHLGWTGMVCFEGVCDCSFQKPSPFPSTGHSKGFEKQQAHIGSVTSLCRRLKHPLKTSQNCSIMVSNASFCLSFGKGFLWFLSLNQRACRSKRNWMSCSNCGKRNS